MATSEQFAALPDPPASAVPYARVLWFLKDSVAAGVTYLLYEFGKEIAPTATGPDDPDAAQWRRWVLLFEDTLSGDAADNQQFSVDVINYTNGDVDNSWTDADHGICVTNLRAFCTAIASQIASRYTLTQIKAYRMAFNAYPAAGTPISQDKPFAESGPPVWLDDTDLVMTGGTSIPPQVCTTISERTPSRVHWGRLYLPTIGAGALAPSGRLNTVAVDAISTAYNQLYGNLVGSGFAIVVPTTRDGNGNRLRTLQQVTAISIDDVVDAHHRRRHRAQTYRVIIPGSTQLLPAP